MTYRIRLHGRGGQGIKTAGRILGSAFFRAGFEVQDAPRYGAERRGAPMFAYVRAAKAPIFERGVIEQPDLVVVADDTLVGLGPAGIATGLGPGVAVLIATDESPETWRSRLPGAPRVLTLTRGEPGEERLIATRAAAAAARLVGVISREQLGEAVRDELEALGPRTVERNREAALDAFDAFESEAGTVLPARARAAARSPDWVDLSAEGVERSAPAIFAAATSVQVHTGLWRTMRPVVDRSLCHRCHFICTTLCPDNALLVGDDGYPTVDLDHCKGCLECVAACPFHAIGAVPERDAQAAEPAAQREEAS